MSIFHIHTYTKFILIYIYFASQRKRNKENAKWKKQKTTQINREEVAHIRRENIVNRKSGNNRKKTTTTAATTDDYDVSKSQSKPE